jgi:hypothetical protein
MLDEKEKNNVLPVHMLSGRTVKRKCCRLLVDFSLRSQLADSVESAGGFPGRYSTYLDTKFKNIGTGVPTLPTQLSINQQASFFCIKLLYLVPGLAKFITVRYLLVSGISTQIPTNPTINQSRSFYCLHKACLVYFVG